MRRALAIAETVLSLGLNRVIAKLRAHPRFARYAFAAIAINEIWGVQRAYAAGHYFLGWW